jgi:hypothetical protein
MAILDDEKRKFWTPEFVLVWTMLLVLLALVTVILFVPAGYRSATDVTFAAVAEYRKTNLSIVITTFGVWVGAGAAYFFGKENLRTATNSMLAMRDQSPQERLRRTSIRAIPPRPLDWVIKNSDTVASVVERLRAEPQRWFIPVVKNDESLDTLLHEQAVWRFVDKLSSQGTAYDDILKKTISDVLNYVKTTPGLEKDVNISVTVSMDQSTGEAYDLMQSKKCFWRLCWMRSRGRNTISTPRM